MDAHYYDGCKCVRMGLAHSQDVSGCRALSEKRIRQGF